MAILRNPQKENFTVVGNPVLRDKNLSLKAKGLLVSMLSLPDNWEFSENGLEKIFLNDGRDSIRSALKELEQGGYLSRDRARGTDGRLAQAVWIVSDSPISEKPMLENPTLEKPTLEKPTLEKPTLEKPTLENHTQLNTKQSNTNQLKKEELNTYREDKEFKESSSILFQSIYNSECTNLSSCLKITEKRKKAIRSFLKEFSVEQWQEICQKANQSGFLTGQGDRGWKADIDFLLRTDKAAKILEGGYSDGKAAKKEDEVLYGVYL